MYGGLVPDPYGFNVLDQIVRCRTAGTSISIAAGALVIFDFLNGTNDRRKSSDSGTTVARNGFTTVLPYVHATNDAKPGVYGIAIDPITTNSSGEVTAFGRVGLFGVFDALCDGAVAVDDQLRPSSTADTAKVMKKAVYAGAAADTACVLGIALAAGTDTTISILFNGFAFNGTRLAA